MFLYRIYKYLQKVVLPYSNAGLSCDVFLDQVEAGTLCAEVADVIHECPYQIPSCAGLNPKYRYKLHFICSCMKVRESICNNNANCAWMLYSFCCVFLKKYISRLRLNCSQYGRNIVAILSTICLILTIWWTILRQYCSLYYQFQQYGYNIW